MRKKQNIEKKNTVLKLVSIKVNELQKKKKKILGCSKKKPLLDLFRLKMHHFL